MGGQLFAAWLASRLASLHAEVLYNNTEPVVYPSIERADAVSSMVYEANARMKDPVHGCASEVDQLRKEIAELEVQLAAAQQELQKMMWIVADMASQLIPGSNVLQTTLEDDDTDQLWDSLWD